MSAIYIMLPISLLLAGIFLAAYIWSVRSGQFEDTTTPAMRILPDDKPVSLQSNTSGAGRTLPTHEPAGQPTPDPSQEGNSGTERVRIQAPLLGGVGGRFRDTNHERFSSVESLPVGQAQLKLPEFPIFKNTANNQNKPT